MQVDYVYDIETENWTTFVIGALYDGSKIEIYDWRREEEFVKRLLSLNGEVYAHNGGRFDHLWLLDAAYRYSLQKPGNVLENATGIISLEFENVKFKDSFRLFPMPLRTLTNGKKDNLRALCKCGRDCGGYCAITRRMAKSVAAKVQDYLTTDVRELWRALSHFERIARECRIELGLTLGSTSWKSAAAELNLPPQPYGNGHSTIGLAQWRFVRESYYGGRCEPFKRISEKGYKYDVNSMYPAKIASIELPLDYEGKRYGSAANKAYRNGRPGSYRAIVVVPDSFVPPLPIRVKTRVLYPHGKITGVWTANELQYAESIGVRIEKIVESATFAHSKVIFKPWVERIFKVRMKYGKNTREGYWLKLILNSITGKFGAKVNHRSYVIDPCFGIAGKCPDHCGKQRLDGIYGLTPAGNPATTRVWFKEYERIPKCGHVEWAAYLTAEARITLHKGLTEGGYDDAVYCDTDGIFCEKRRSENIGNELGQWKDEGGYESFACIAPKVYCFHDSKGEQSVRAKGIPNAPKFNPEKPRASKKAIAEFWKKVIEGQALEYWSIAGIRNPQEGRFFVRRYLARHVSPNLGGRMPGKGNLTCAPSADDIHLFT